MKKIAIAFFICVLFFVSNKSLAQNYKIAFGLRGGWTTGFSGKYFIQDGQAIEGIFSSGWGWAGFQLTGLYEIHKPAFADKDVEGLFWFYGGGVHVSAGYSYDEWIPPHGPYIGYYDRHHYGAFGIDGIFGIEYKIAELPVTIGLDVKPFIEFSGYKYAPFNFWDAGLTIRYTMKNTLK